MPQIKLAPSILSADHAHVNQEIKQVEPLAKLIHVDIMDGVFVPNKTFKPDFVQTIQTPIPLDVHLMVHDPSNDLIKAFIDAGAHSITVHQEACSNLTQTINFIKQQNTNVCIALKPKTPLDTILPVLDLLNMVLIMTVEPGEAGQAFIAQPLQKVTKLRELKPDLDIEVDGGVSKETIRQCYDAGANVFVAGSAIFKKQDRVHAINDLLAQLP